MNPLLGGASAKALGWVGRYGKDPPPAAFATTVAPTATPPTEGIFLGEPITHSLETLAAELSVKVAFTQGLFEASSGAQNRT